MKRSYSVLVLGLVVATCLTPGQTPSPAVRWDARQSLIGFWVGEDGPGES